ncbi:MAG TPA: hypothetical protein VF172_10980 [Nitrososphaera sp.]|jgi:hypothetical protein
MPEKQRNARHLLAIHTRYKNRNEIRSRGIKQRLIIKLLALQVSYDYHHPSKSNVTRGVLAEFLSDNIGISRVNAYHYVFKELDECLVLNRFVEECGTIATGKGPRLLQEIGTPCYCLTPLGMLVASTLEDEFDLRKRVELVEYFLRSKKALDTHAFSFVEKLLLHLHKYPQKTLDLIRYSTMEYINGETTDPLDSAYIQGH